MKSKQFPFSLKNMFFYFLKLGAFGFGGAITLANIIHKDLVGRHKWITEEEYKQGLAFIQFSPGPLVSQLSMYIGFLRANVIGATVAIVAFLLPSFFIVLAISIFYVHYGNISLMRGALYGIGASVVGIITSSAYSLTRKTVTRPLLWIIVFGIFLTSLITGSVNFLFFIGAGLLTMIVYTKSSSKFLAINYVPLAVLPAVQNNLLFKIFLFFLSAGSLAFGGGFAILPYLQSGVVNQFHWLTNKQFLDAVAVAMITPGPVVITSVFIGYIVAGFTGSLIALLGMFLPAYLLVVVLTPILRKHANNIYLQNFTEGVIAAAMGAIAGAIVILAKDSITDYFTAILAISSLLLVRFFKLQSILIILAAGFLGILFFHP